MLWNNWHDGKTIYLLTQHSIFNRKHNQFFLYRCKWEFTIHNRNHICEVIPHAYHVSLYNSLRYTWDRNIRNQGDNYTSVLHRYWSDEHYFGISHYSIHPDHLHHDCIQFNGFNIRIDITVHILKDIRNFMVSKPL